MPQGENWNCNSKSWDSTPAGALSFWSLLGPYWVHWGSSECQSEYFLILKLRSKFFEKPVFGQKVKRFRGGHFEGFSGRGQAGYSGNVQISIFNVSGDGFENIFVRGFRSDSGGWFSMILGRSVGQALGRSVGPPSPSSLPLPHPPSPPSPKKCGGVVRLLCGSFV